MKEVLKNIFYRLANAGTLALCLLYLSTLLVPYIDTGRYWMISILALGFPLLLMGMVAALFFWILLRSRKAWICLVVILLGYQQIGVTIAFHWPATFQLKKSDSTFRVMQWNVHSWNEIRFSDEKEFDSTAQPKMMALIKKYDPDVLTLPEFFESMDRSRFASNIKELQQMGFKYYYFVNSGLTDRVYYGGTALFSKYPILQSKRVYIDSSGRALPAIASDISKEGKMIRIIAVHLESVRFEINDYENLSNIKRSKGTELSGGRTVLSKLKSGFTYRYSQAAIISRQVAESPYPVIVCGDFNDVPNSGVYFTIRKNLQDAFLKKGFFIGRTFRFISPTLRIDYILPSRQFEVKQFAVIRAAYSDHYPVVTDVVLK